MVWLKQGLYAYAMRKKGIEISSLVLLMVNAVSMAPACYDLVTFYDFLVSVRSTLAIA